MRIISKQKDYYDCIQAQGQDRTIVYVRDPQEVEVDAKNWKFSSFDASFYGPLGTDIYFVGFCGKVYPCLRVGKTLYHGATAESVQAFCYTVADIDNFAHRYLKDRELEAYQTGKNPSRRYSWRWGSYKKTSHDDFTRYFNDWEEHKPNCELLFTEKRSPIFVARHYNRWQGGLLTYNALLRPYEFMKVFDPYRAFQEISMWMGNLANPEKTMPIIPDEMKLLSHGFDRYSFRQPKGKDIPFMPEKKKDSFGSN